MLFEIFRQLLQGLRREKNATFDRSQFEVFLGQAFGVLADDYKVIARRGKWEKR